MGAAAADLLESGVNAWNLLVGYALSLLQISPETYNSEAWNMVTILNNYLFVPVGSSLLTFFFIIGFCQETTDLKANVRIESIIGNFVKLFFAQIFVVYNMQIIQGIFTAGSKLVTAVLKLVGGADGSTELDMSIITSYLRSFGDLDLAGLGYIILHIFVLPVFVVLAVMMFYTIMVRILKVYVLIPWGAIAFSTYAGGRGIGQTSAAFLKYIICLAGESLFIVLAVVISSIITNNGGLGLLTAFGVTMPTEISECSFGVIFLLELEMMIGCLVTLGIVKGGQSIMQKAFAL